jgi:hypothetical protein
MNFLRFFPVDSWTYGAEHEYGDCVAAERRRN